MTKVYYRNTEINSEEAKTLPLREEVLISFDGGKTKHSLHKDAQAMKRALEENVIEFSYVPYSRDYLFMEIIQSDDEVVSEVLDCVWDKGQELGFELEIDGALSLVNHPSVLEWLLKKGAKCQHVQGYGTTTMENFIWKKQTNRKYSDEFIALLKEYDAIDKKYLKEYKKLGGVWDSKAIAAFCEIRVYFDGYEFGFTGTSIAALPLSKEVLISFDWGETKQNLHTDAQAMKRALEENVIEFGVIQKAPHFPFLAIIDAEDEVSHEVLDILAAEAEKKDIDLVLNYYIGRVTNPSVLEWFLKKGIKCGPVKSNNMTESFLRRKKMKVKNIDECISLLKKYDAIDKNYIEAQREEWPTEVIVAFM